MLAVCSDLDQTPGFGTYLEIARYLNSNEETSMGPGVGLEIGNTIFFDMAPGEAAYWNGTESERGRIRALLRSGHIDCLHSFGDLATTRGHAARALDELDRHGCKISVWIDHAVAPTNFGPDIMRGTGDLPGSPAYHSDLTLGFGVRYVWRGRVTSVTGQDVPRRLRGIFDPRHPLPSARTLAKETVKGLLGRLGAGKYEIHPPNRLLRPVRLRDGRVTLEFLRANPFWAAVDRGDTADGFAEVMTSALLERLVERGGSMILYTHLGKVRDPRVPFGQRTRAAFERLAEAQRTRGVLVTTTRRLLDFVSARGETTWETGHRDGALEIRVAAAGDGAGLSFKVADPSRTRLIVNGRPCEAPLVSVEGPAGSGVIGVPWRSLEWPRP